MDPLNEAAVALMAALKEERIPAAIAGGLAANAWVAPCDIVPTFDVDAAVLLPAGGEIDALDLARRITEKRGARCIAAGDVILKKVKIVRFLCLPGAITVDLVLADPAFAKAALGRSGTVRIGEGTVPVLAPEDAILYKGLARRAKDLGPIAAIARAQKLDRRYVERWARKLGVWQFVSRAMRG